MGNFLDGAEFDGASGFEGGAVLGDFSGFFEVARFEEVEAADHFFGEDIGAIGDGDGAMSFSDGFAGVLEAIGGDEAVLLAKLFGEGFVFGDGGAAVFLGEGGKCGFGGFGVVEEEDVLVHVRVSVGGGWGGQIFLLSILSNYVLI